MFFKLKILYFDFSNLNRRIKNQVMMVQDFKNKTIFLAEESEMRHLIMLINPKINNVEVKSNSLDFQSKHIDLDTAETKKNS